MNRKWVKGIVLKRYLDPQKAEGWLAGFGFHLSSLFGIKDRIFILSQLLALPLTSAYQEKLDSATSTLEHPLFLEIKLSGKLPPQNPGVQQPTQDIWRNMPLLHKIVKQI